ncbi:U-box domain-containing protein 52, partial [Tetrabaena socialis]
MRQLAGVAAAAHLVVSRANGLPLLKGPNAVEVQRLMTSVTAALASDGIAGLLTALGSAGSALVERTQRALDACLAALEAGSCASSPAGLLLMSGPLARRLRECLGQLGEAIAAMQGEVAGTDGAALLAAVRDGLLCPKLEALDQRANRAGQLGQLLAAITQSSSSTAAHAALLACVRQALQDEGVAAEALQEPQPRSLLVDELLSFSGCGLLSEGEESTVNTVAEALLLMDGGDVTPPTPPTPPMPPTRPTAPTGSTAATVPTPPPSFLCPIYHTLMRDPCTNDRGHTYEKKALQAWLRSNDTDPTT